MKKLISSIVLASLFIANNLTASAGGYCPTWVKTSEETSEAGVFSAGEEFEASNFEVTAGESADVYIEKLKIRIRGGFSAKDVEKIYLVDDNGTTYGTTTKLGGKGTGFLFLDTPLLVEKASTEQLHLFFQSKSTIRKNASLTLGILDFFGSMEDEVSTSSLYCSSYGELKDSVWGTLHSVVQ